MVNAHGAPDHGGRRARPCVARCCAGLTIGDAMRDSHAKTAGRGPAEHNQTASPTAREFADKITPRHEPAEREIIEKSAKHHFLRLPFCPELSGGGLIESAGEHPCAGS